jgi:hypothetical protein
MKIKHVGIGALAVVCGMMATSAAQAESISAQLATPTLSPGLTSGLYVTFVGGTPTSQVNTGQINWKVTATDNTDYTVGEKFSTYCIQGEQYVTTGQTYNYSIVGLGSTGQPEGGTDAGVLDSTAAMQIQGLVNSYFADAGVVDGSYDANQTAAAFQLAIWEIEYDGGSGGETFTSGGSTNFFGSGDGLVRATGVGSEASGAVTLANYWLNHFTKATAVSSLALVSGNAQDQLICNVPSGSGQQSSVPLPAAFPAGAALLAGMFGARKLRRKAV